MSDTEKLTSTSRRSLFAILRTYFLTGLVITAPLAITIYLMIVFITFLDNLFRPFIPRDYRPETYLPFDIPGTGLVLGVVALIIIGGIMVHFAGRWFLSITDRIIGRMPVAGTVYRALRQIFESATRTDGASFSQVALIEYPRTGIYTMGFVTRERETPLDKAAGKNLIGIFVPTTPNPTSGFLLFLPREDVRILDMTVETAARFIISAGLTDD